MNRPLALAPIATLALAWLAAGCHPVDLGHGDSGGADASGGGDPGAGGADTASGGAGTGGRVGTGGSGTGAAGTGGSSGTGGSPPQGVCPTAVTGTIATYALAPYTPEGVAIDANAIYWTGSANGLGAGAVLRTDLATGTTTVIADAALDPALPSTAFDYPAGIARSQGDVVWVAGGGQDVQRVPASGGAASTLYHLNTGWHVPGTGSTPHTFTLDANALYWNDSTRSGDLITNTLLAAPLAGGGAVTTMASTTIDINDTQAPPSLPLSLRVDGATAFYTLWAGATTMSVTRRVGTDGQNGADVFGAGFLLATDGVNLFDVLESMVLKMPEGGGTPSTVVDPPNGNVFETYQGVVLHGGDVYLTSFGGAFDGQEWVMGCGWVKKVPKAGGTPTILWAGTGRPFDLAVDDAGVTWTDLDNATVTHLVP